MIPPEHETLRYRGTHPNVFRKNCVLSKFIGKHLRASHFLNKVARHRYFAVNFAIFFGTTCYKQHLRCLLLCHYISCLETFYLTNTVTTTHTEAMKKNFFIMYERDQPNKNTFIGRKRLSSVTYNANEWSWMKYSKNSNYVEMRDSEIVSVRKSFWLKSFTWNF